jgi:hypothetical protein
LLGGRSLTWQSNLCSEFFKNWIAAHFVLAMTGFNDCDEGF